MASVDPLEKAAKASLVQIRRICADLPECVLDSGKSGGLHHRLSVRDKTMAWHTVDHHGDGRVSLSVRAPRGDNTALVAADPDKFFLPHYVAHHGYVGIHLDVGKVDWTEVRELIVDAYRVVAPKRLAKLFE